MIVWILWLVAIAVNFLVDQKKGNGMLTSCVCFLNAIFIIWYIIAYWVGDSAKALYKLPKEIQSHNHKAGKVFYWFFLVTSLAGIALPAAMGGLSSNKI